MTYTGSYEEGWNTAMDQAESEMYDLRTRIATLEAELKCEHDDHTETQNAVIDWLAQRDAKINALRDALNESYWHLRHFHNCGVYSECESITKQSLAALSATPAQSLAEHVGRRAAEVSS